MSCCECRRKEDGFFKSFTELSNSESEQSNLEESQENSMARTSHYLSLLYSVGSSIVGSKDRFETRENNFHDN